jgi:pyruvate/2-oxoglutarate/acetoin dehydrogenase E1 component
MFGDFLGLCFDQIVNHVSKYEAMYNGAATCPVVIRTPSGGGRGYGPTHSQSLEKHFLGVPHLRVVAASLWHDPAALFAGFLAGDGPALHIEHKLLYPLEVSTGDAVEQDGSTVSIRLVARDECTLTVVAYGYPAELARRVLHRLAREEEIFAELLVPAQLAPVEWAPLERSLAVTGSLLTVEEGTAGWSWGSELAAGLGSRVFGRLRRAPEVLASACDIVPGAREREAAMLVGERAIEDAVRRAAA